MTEFNSVCEGPVFLDVTLLSADIEIEQDPQAAHTTVTYPDGVLVTEANGVIRIGEKRPSGGQVVQSFGNVQVSGGITFIDSARSVNIVHMGGRTVTTVVQHTGSAGRTVTVRCPERSSVVADSSSGDVRVTGVSDRVDIKAMSGDVRLGTCAHIQADLTSGDLEAVVGGSANVKATSGDVRLSAAPGASGPVTVKAVSGDVFTPGMAHLKTRVTTVSGEWHPY